MADDKVHREDLGNEEESPFEQALRAYRHGASGEDLLPVFVNIVRASPNHGPAWTCLCWLQLLANRPLAALRSGRMAVRVNPHDPQAHLNLSLAMLETNLGVGLQPGPGKIQMGLGIMGVDPHGHSSRPEGSQRGVRQQLQPA